MTVVLREGVRRYTFLELFFDRTMAWELAVRRSQEAIGGPMTVRERQ